MDKSWNYEICVEGRIAERWSEWFEGLIICVSPTNHTTLSGPLTDQAALFGVLNKIHALNLCLVSVARQPLQEEFPIAS